MRILPLTKAALLPLISLTVLVASSDGHEITSFSLQPVAGSPQKRLASITAILAPNVDHIVEDSPDLVRWYPVSPVMRPSGLLNWSHVQTEILGPFGTGGLYQTATSNWASRRFYRVRMLPAGNPAPTITGSAVPKYGRLTQLEEKGAYRIITEGNWSIRMQGTTITIRNPAGTNGYEIWGEGSGGTGHENLNGKHIKDNFGGSRTILIPDGTIVTVGLSTVSGTNAIASFSIYTGDQSHRLTTKADPSGNPNTVIMSVPLRRAGEAQEADGETCRMLDTPQGAYLENIYIQTNSNGQAIPQESVPLGLTGGAANPNMVIDYYDDPWQGHT